MNAGQRRRSTSSGGYGTEIRLAEIDDDAAFDRLRQRGLRWARAAAMAYPPSAELVEVELAEVDS